ncbi:MAG: UDP-3-O-(3-hydroxymyristoyl)glucosamine N-acyltransferase [Sedimentisphaerales bacterium]|nr:UDP-3-O-(3-hydroxymyristoyl)glucosamine N-acyltransferase [Sedimentisphaerales bacterium]
MALTIRELAARLGAELVGDDANADGEIVGVQPVATAGSNAVTFVSDPRHKSAATKCLAAALIVDKPIEGLAKPQLVVGNVNAAVIEALNCFAPKLKPPAEGIDASARVGENVRLGKAVSIGPHAVIADNVEIGEGTAIADGCHIGENSRIGAHCRLDSHVVVYHGCVLGHHVIVQANSTIGSVGFGYSFIDGAHRLFPHNGGVIIEDFVHIGANSCIDRAKFGNTIIGAGTKIDNLVQIAHNVVIGKCCLIAAQVGVAGSCRLGDGVVLAGQVGLADNIEVGAGTMVGAQAGVVSTVGPGLKLAWSPAIEVREAARVVAHVLRLPKLAQELKRLTAKVEKLEAAEDNKERG